MSILNRIKSALGKKEEISEVALDTFANLPLFQMLQEDRPFNDWRSPEAEIPEGLEDTFKMYVWMYQMYVFYMLSATRFGYEIADTILSLQVNRLNKASEELGKQLEIAIRQIHKSVVNQVNGPRVIEVKGEQIEIPIEYAIAMCDQLTAAVFLRPGDVFQPRN